MGEVESEAKSKKPALDKRLLRIFEVEWPKARVRLTNYELALLREALENLVGEPLTYMVRLSTAQYLSFGVQKPCKDLKGDDSTRSDWGLMIGGSCHWKFEGPNDFRLGTDDFGPEGERRDEHAKPFYSRLNKDSIVVDKVQILEDGTQVLSFTDGFSLTIKMPDGVSRYSEPWRFMPPRHDFRGHLCLMEFGLKWGYKLNGPRQTNARARYSRRNQIKYEPGTRLKKAYNRADQAKWRLKYGRNSQWRLSHGP